MLRIDKAILDTNDVICSNISQLGFTDRGLLSQNILGQIRNFVEYIAIKTYSNDKDVDPNDRNLNVAALKNMQRRGDLRFLYKFHRMLQKSVSHYTVDRDGSERLMLKYYEYLLKIKLYLKRFFNLNVLENISDFPLDTDTELLDYYEKIAERIETPSASSCLVAYNDRYYVQKVKPFLSIKRSTTKSHLLRRTIMQASSIELSRLQNMKLLITMLSNSRCITTQFASSIEICLFL